MSAVRRVRLTFASLLTAAVLAVGLVGRALAWPPSPTAGIAVAIGSIVAVVSGGLALRILVVLDRGR